MGCVMLITNSECSVTRMATGVKKMRKIQVCDKLGE